MSDVDTVVRVVREGGLAILPTDTVYGLVCTAFEQQPAADLYRLKGREAIQPTAILAASVDVLLEHIPELAGRSEELARALLPGPFTLVVPNPAHRFHWLSANNPAAIGIRVPGLPGPAGEAVARLGAVVATSANLPGEPDPRRLVDVPASILEGVGAALDGGELPGVPSTVVDVTGSEPVVVREGAVDAAAALRRIAEARRRA